MSVNLGHDGFTCSDFRYWRKWLPAIGVFCAGMTLTAIAFLITLRIDRERLAAAFKFAARNECSSIRRQMNGDVEVIRSLTAFYAASEKVEPDEFHLFASTQLKDHPAIRALEWAPRVPADQRESFERAMAAEGQDQFRIKAWNSHSVPASSPDSDHVPVTFIEPRTGNEPALGLDLASETVRRLALLEAVQSEQIVTAGPLQLIQESGSSSALLMIQAIFPSNDGAGETSAAPLPDGFVIAVIDLKDQIDAAMASIAHEPMVVHLFDLDGPPDAPPVYVHGETARSSDRSWQHEPSDIAAPLHAEEFLLAGKRWGILCVAKPAFAHIRQNWHHWGVGGTGMVLTLLLSAYVRSMTGRTHSAEFALAETREELDLARRVQMGLLPSMAPQLPGIDIAGASFPATQVSGDHFDFINVDNQRLGIVISDASGHGLGAAMLMVEMRACLRTAMGRGEQMGEILGVANRVLTEGMPEDRFITLLLASLDPVNRAIVYANAGHPSGFVLDRHGRCKHSLTSNSIPIGIDHSAPYTTSASIQLVDGDLVLLLTDGILDAMSSTREMFGEERTLELVRKHRHEPAARIIELLHDSILRFCGRLAPHDDMTVVIIKLTDSNPQFAEAAANSREAEELTEVCV